MTFTEKTQIKLQKKIYEIQEYLLFYQKYKNKFSKDEYGTVNRQTFISMAHRAIYVMYRSIFKKVEDKIIDIDNFTYDEFIINKCSQFFNEYYR
jgi:hypothetical protein